MAGAEAAPFRFTRYGAGVHHWPHGWTWRFARNPELDGWHALWAVTGGEVICDFSGTERLCQGGQWFLWRYNVIDGGFRPAVPGAAMDTAWVFLRPRRDMRLPDWSEGQIDDLPMWLSLMQRCRKALSREHPETATIASAWAQALLIESGITCALPAASNPVTGMRDRIRENPAADWTPATLADALQMSPRRLTTMCRRSFGCTTRALVLRTKVEAALHLLEISDLPLKHIASATGFFDQAALSHAIRRHTGLAAGAWRKSGR